jgi:aspartate aminotransferase
MAGTRGEPALSATLAANELLARARRAGQPVLAMSFGEAGLPVHPLLTAALAAAAGSNSYSPVAGLPALREAAAGYWARRGLPTAPEQVVAGPGSKPLLFGLLLAIGTDVAIPRPSWVSYAAQTAIAGARAHRVPAEQGGVCDPDRLAGTVTRAAAAGRRIGAVIVTLPDNPTGRLASRGTVAALAEVARAHDLVIISDEIYRDLRFDTSPPFCGPAELAPERTVITTGLSKSLALGGWRLGAARFPDSQPGRALARRVLGIASEIWSAAASPVQEAAALGFAEPPALAERVARSRRLHAAVSCAVAATFAAAGLAVGEPQGAFYTYPDFAPWRGHLAARHGVTTGAGLAGLLLDRCQLAVLPGSAFGEDERSLRVREATSLLYGAAPAEREEALRSPDPLKLPWIAAALRRLGEILADLSPAGP